MKLLIIIPAYNEAQNIVHTVEELRAALPDTDFLVVNDGSSDATPALCREHGYPLLDLPANLGLTGAFQSGIRYAYEHGYDAALQFDGDGQHDPAFIPVMAEKMTGEALDLVIGSRFVTEKRPRSMRMAGNALLEFTIRLTTGCRVTDPTSGFRLYGKRLLRIMAYGINESPEPDTIAYLLRSGARFAEVQVRMRERVAGESYLSFGRSVKYMVQMCMDILFLQWARKRSDALCLG